MTSMLETLYGLDKKDGLKQWCVAVEKFDRDFALLKISHGKVAGKQTLKSETFTEGKQGRTPFEQACSEAQAKIKKQMDKGYRATIEELTSLPLLAMLAGDFNKIGHRIKFPCYSSVKLDGVRCLAKKKDGVVTLESRTGQPYILPHIVEQLQETMYEGQVLDGEIYFHGALLQDIMSAVKRTDPAEAFAKAQRKLAKATPEQKADAEAEYAEAIMILELRPKLEFWIFDVLEDGGREWEFYDRLCQLEGEKLAVAGKTHLKVLDYDVVNDEQHLKNVLHPKAVREGFEGVMLRNHDGLYESGKRSADLQKYKTFLDTEFEVVGYELDKDGGIIYVCRNDLNNLTFNVVMGSMDERKQRAAIGETFIGLWLTVKYQSRYKGTLLPQFPVGLHFREGSVHNGEFVPSN